MSPYSLLCIKPDFVPSHIIDFLLELKNTNTSPALVGYDDNQEVTDHRKTKWIALSDEIRGNLLNTIGITHQQYLTSLYNSEIDFIEPPQLLKYEVGDYYDVHNDSESFVDNRLARVVKRDISVLLYLNNDYEGGELEFTYLNLTIKPKAGMLIAFPSYIEFEHKVHPVTKGTRFSIVSWICTKKRIYPRPYEMLKDNFYNYGHFSNKQFS